MNKNISWESCCFTLSFCFLSIIAFCQKNPMIDGWYADPEAVIFDKTYWIYPTYSARYEKQVFLDAFSSKDMAAWKKHPDIIDTSIIKWAKMAMWAPAIVKKENRYYLFFSANDIQSKQRNGVADDTLGGIGVAVADHPGGPFKDYLGKPLINHFYNSAQPIDQYVFRDKDGQYYIIYGGWGRCNLAKLNENFTGLVPFADNQLVQEITPKGYVEGPTMFIRNGKYYLMWSEGGWTNGTYKVAYAIPITYLDLLKERPPYCRQMKPWLPAQGITQ